MQISRKIVFVVAALITLSSTIVTYAVLNTVTLTDIVSITETPSRRSTVKDAIDLTDNAYNNNQITQDNLAPTDGSTPASAVRDDLLLGESAQAITSMFYSVSVSSIVDISERPTSGISASESIEFNETIGKNAGAGIDVLSLLDSVSRAFLVLVSESVGISDSTQVNQDSAGTEDEDEEDRDRRDGGRGRSEPSTLVFDESFLRDNPLKRFQFRSFALTDSEGSSFAKIRQGELTNITALVRNYQAFSQDYIFIVQITDTDTGYTESILLSPGSLDSAKTTTVNLQWKAQQAGTSYKIKAMIWTGLDNPIALSDSISKTLDVAG